MCFCEEMLFALFCESCCYAFAMQLRKAFYKGSDIPDILPERNIERFRFQCKFQTGIFYKQYQIIQVITIYINTNLKFVISGIKLDKNYSTGKNYESHAKFHKTYYKKNAFGN